MEEERKFSIVIETMKHMYENKTLSISQIKKSYNNQNITLDEYNYILGKVR